MWSEQSKSYDGLSDSELKNEIKKRHILFIDDQRMDPSAAGHLACNKSCKEAYRGPARKAKFCKVLTGWRTSESQQTNYYVYLIMFCQTLRYFSVNCFFMTSVDISLKASSFIKKLFTNFLKVTWLKQNQSEKKTHPRHSLMFSKGWDTEGEIGTPVGVSGVHGWCSFLWRSKCASIFTVGQSVNRCRALIPTMIVICTWSWSRVFWVLVD